MPSIPWFPTIEYILIIFKENIENPVLINRQGLLATLDKMRWGIPTQRQPSIWDSVVILFKDVVEQHFFLDGNKRIGILLADLFLYRNNFSLDPAVGEIFRITIETAQGNVSYGELKKWFEQNSRTI
jgi:death-on-curing family protein